MLALILTVPLLTVVIMCDLILIFLGLNLRFFILPNSPEFPTASSNLFRKAWSFAKHDHMHLVHLCRNTHALWPKLSPSIRQHHGSHSTWHAFANFKRAISAVLDKTVRRFFFTFNHPLPFWKLLKKLLSQCTCITDLNGLV